MLKTNHYCPENTVSQAVAIREKVAEKNGTDQEMDSY